MTDSGRHPPDEDQAAGLPAAPARARYRVVFGKEGVLRYTSHLDLARIWERVLRRAGVPLIYSQGFNPRPQIQLAAALPLGCASRCERLDMWLEGEIDDLDGLLVRLREQAPEGLTVESIEPVDLRGPALQSQTRSAVYHIIPASALGIGELQARVEALLAQPAIWRERRGRRYDLRPLIWRLEVVPEHPPALRLEVSLSAQGGTGRPDEVLEALSLDPLGSAITRTAITFTGDPA